LFLLRNYNLIKIASSLYSRHDDPAQAHQHFVRYFLEQNIKGPYPGSHDLAQQLQSSVPVKNPAALLAQTLWGILFHGLLKSDMQSDSTALAQLRYTENIAGDIKPGSFQSMGVADDAR